MQNQYLLKLFIFLTCLGVTKVYAQEAKYLTFLDLEDTLYLTKVDRKCGEWGGDKETIKISRELRPEGKTVFFAEYESTTINCEDPNNKNKSARTYSKRKVQLTETETLLAYEAIQELIQNKLKEDKSVFYNGYKNSVFLSDSTFIVKYNNRGNWEKFDQLKKVLWKM